MPFRTAKISSRSRRVVGSRSPISRTKVVYATLLPFEHEVLNNHLRSVQALLGAHSIVAACAAMSTGL